MIFFLLFPFTGLLNCFFLFFLSLVRTKALLWVLYWSTSFLNLFNLFFDITVDSWPNLLTLISQTAHPYLISKYGILRTFSTCLSFGSLLFYNSVFIVIFRHFLYYLLLYWTSFAMFCIYKSVFKDFFV